MTIISWPNSYVITGSLQTFHIVIGMFWRQTSNWWTSKLLPTNSYPSPQHTVSEASHSLFFHLSICHLLIHSTSIWWIPAVKERQIRLPFLSALVDRVRHTSTLQGSAGHWRKNLGSFQEKELTNCSEISSSPELGTQNFHRKGWVLLPPSLLTSEWD